LWPKCGVIGGVMGGAKYGAKRGEYGWRAPWISLEKSRLAAVICR
jgi:hypothetical protein